MVFLPSKTHPNVPVLNRYYGIKEDGSIKVRGLDVRKRGLLRSQTKDLEKREEK
jgi:hypothetical protein